MIRSYNEEFVLKLLEQSLDQKSRYAPVLNKEILVGDLVLIKDDNMKQSSYPMGRIKKTIVNNLGEVTAVQVQKGNTREVLKRHVGATIPYLRLKVNDDVARAEPVPEKSAEAPKSGRPRRKAAEAARRRIADSLT